MNDNYKRVMVYFRVIALTLIAIIVANEKITAQSKSGFRIDITIKDATDSVLYLANYYGDKTYLTDTAYLDKKGHFVFEADTLLPAGVYILAGQHNNKYFEIIANKEQQFKVQTALPDLYSGIQFKNSKENMVFYDFINYNVNIQKTLHNLADSLAKLEKGSESAQQINDSVQALRTRLNKYKQNVIDENPDLFVSVLLKGMDDPRMEDFGLTQKQLQDSVFTYQYYKNHYWDDFNPADARLLRTPVYHRKLETYFNKIIYQHPDSLIREIDKFIARVDTNPETFKYTVWFLTYKFETSNVMGFDEIFVHMIDKYYATGRAFWTGKSTLKTLEERADALRNILIGADAPNMILMDTSGGFASLYRQDANYIIVLFYEEGCAHCRKEIKALKAWDQEDSLDFKVFAVCTDTNLVAWKKFIKSEQLPWIHVNGTRSVTPDYHHLYDIRVTPTIFLLDNRKKIIAKRLKVDQLKPFLEHYEMTRKRSD
ncbi:MAG TPA: DUF5106 domain-containing protein [Bacteroidales bacterium]|nr:DUF5106 domain-containing protein [Bacteroidales bacterium]HRX95687.1 DUF5106 domain-containing protein [Bacteroidales bacterium]